MRCIVHSLRLLNISVDVHQGLKIICLLPKFAKLTNKNKYFKCLLRKSQGLQYSYIIYENAYLFKD